VPAAITGTFEALVGRRGYIPRPEPIRVRFGTPLRFTTPTRDVLTQRVRADVTTRIMDEIAALLADERRRLAPLKATGGPRGEGTP
jgi:hypothetical protein